jgi:DNA-binding MarR family transcriptional regulator
MPGVTNEYQATARASAPESGRDATPRLGYLLKHAQLRFTELTSAAFAPLGIRVHEWAALNGLDEQRGLSQREAADLLGIDRTTMVAMVDELENKGLVERRPQADDRRKNTISLTSSGRTMIQRGARLVDACERRFLEALDESSAQHLKESLEIVINSYRSAASQDR